MEKVDTARAEQDVMDDLQLQQERAQQEEEQAAKEAELEEKEAEYIRQLDVKEINEDRFWELVGELDLERAMGESVTEGPATTQAMTQDKEVGESERDECKGTSVHFLTSPVLSHSTLVHMYSPSPPLY
jgi:hypothetical protein